MVFFRVVWAIDIMVALVFVFFFFIGLGDGSVSSFNIVLWLAILGGLAAIIVGANVLARNGSIGPAVALSALPALPALLYGLFILVAVTGGVH